MHEEYGGCLRGVGVASVEVNDACAWVINKKIHNIIYVYIYIYTYVCIDSESVEVNGACRINNKKGREHIRHVMLEEISIRERLKVSIIKGARFGFH